MKNYSRKRTCLSPIPLGIFSRGIQPVASPISTEHSSSSSIMGVPSSLGLQVPSSSAGTMTRSTMSTDPFLDQDGSSNVDEDSSIEILRDAETSLINLPVEANFAKNEFVFENKINFQNLDEDSDYLGQKGNPEFCSTVLYDMADAIPQSLGLVMGLSSIAFNDIPENFSSTHSTGDSTYKLINCNPASKEETPLLTELPSPQLEPPILHTSSESSDEETCFTDHSKNYDENSHLVKKRTDHCLDHYTSVNPVKTSTPLSHRHSRARAVTANIRLYNNNLSAIAANHVSDLIPLHSGDEKESGYPSKSVCQISDHCSEIVASKSIKMSARKTPLWEISCRKNAPPESRKCVKIDVNDGSFIWENNKVIEQTAEYNKSITENCIQQLLETTPSARQISSPNLVPTKVLLLQKKLPRKFKAPCSTSLFKTKGKNGNDAPKRFKGARCDPESQLSPGPQADTAVKVLRMDVNQPETTTTCTLVASKKPQIEAKHISIAQNNTDSPAMVLETATSVIQDLYVSSTQTPQSILENDQHESAPQMSSVKSFTDLDENSRRESSHFDGMESNLKQNDCSSSTLYNLSENGRKSSAVSKTTKKTNKRKRKCNLLAPWYARKRAERKARKSCEASNANVNPNCPNIRKESMADKKNNLTNVKLCDIICLRNPISKPFKVQTFQTPLCFNMDYKHYPLDVLIT